MRVISGICRGKKLFSPPDLSTRPTSDRVKEALFNILCSRIDFSDIRVLDVCAGSGALGIEALSRGARYCCFIECNQSVMAILLKNIKVTNFQDRSETLLTDAVRALQGSPRSGTHYDLVFLDPPYASEMYPHLLEALNAPGILAPHSIVVAECSVRNPLQDSYGNLMRYDRRVYGETALEFFILEG
ncbi:MAG: 16S rRNA (guanine(966)-N(2))-methyltransferase RsmD [Desulfuromonadaceae bacterium]|nr:16S rRNA (guanine(966)-N(2))-methyltransferase RsmD [Desulfuromonadaceae bacterium]